MGATLTDFIQPQVLEREGYIHVSDKAKMLEMIGREYLIEQGWVYKEGLSEIWLPITKASEIAGCSRQTLERYVNDGYVSAKDGRVTMLDALCFDHKKTKAEIAKYKLKIDNAH